MIGLFKKVGLEEDLEKMLVSWSMRLNERGL